MTGIDGSVQPYDNHAMDDTIHLNVYQALIGKNNNMSNESKAFGETTLAKIISLVREEEAIAA